MSQRSLLTRALAAMAVLILSVALASGAAARPGTTAKPAATTPVPQGFVGVDVDGPMFGLDTTLDYPAQLQQMVANGVQSMRAAFNWAFAQPYATMADVPAGQASNYVNVNGRPTDWSLTDEMVGDAARARITVLPTVLYAAPWDARHNPNGVDTPLKNAPFASFMGDLVARYGPHGSFWPQHPSLPRMPIRTWQIWNEENIAYYWPQPFASSYVAMLRLAHESIKKADPGAKVMLGSLTNFAWRSLGQVYNVPGAKSLFDAVAVNDFTKNPADVILYLKLMRRAMGHAQDGQKPLAATEVSWPSAQGQTPQHFDFNTTPAGQARNIATLLPMIGAQRVNLKLMSFYYYTWIGQEAPGDFAFNFSGLLKLAPDGYTVTTKPALGAYRKAALVLEGCRAKGSVATVCLH